MRRIWLVCLAIVVFAGLFVAGGRAAAKSYQFTGVVKAVTGEMLTVEKNSKETWQFETAKDTKGGPAKVGDRVTVSYKMVATEIESKPAPTAAKSKK